MVTLFFSVLTVQSVAALEFHASAPGVVDNGDFAVAFSSGAAAGSDALDVAEPPPFKFNLLDLVSEHGRSEAGWNSQPVHDMRYRQEALPTLAEADTRLVPFVMESDSATTVTLAWTGVDAAGLEQHDVLLRDMSTSATLDLRAGSSIAVGPGLSLIHI